MIGVSERTIRNYINELNKEEVIIEASKNGYRMKHTASPVTAVADLMDNRANLVLFKLLSQKDGINLFDLAQELHVSESTIINHELGKIKQLLKSFHLKIQTHEYQLTIKGKEQDKRKLIGHIAKHNTYGYFTSTETLRNLFPEFDIDEVLHHVFELCQKTSLFLNNYSLNNLLVHILIIIIRLESRNNLNTSDELLDSKAFIEHFHQKAEIMRLADYIATFFETTYHRQIPDKDYHQIILLIALSIEHYAVEELTFEKLSHFMNQQFLDSIASIAQEMSQRYDIPMIDDDFLLQFTLHMYNVYQRATFHVSYPNPIGHQIKKDYAPVYDMAVFFAHKFSVMYHIDINEDEIAFIAFHIGAYLERNKTKKDTISCIIIVENYYNFARTLVTDLKANFHDEFVILDVISYNRYMLIQPACDFIITTIDLNHAHPHKVLINPILTKQNILKIWNELELLEEEKHLVYAKAFLERMLNTSLYFRNKSLESPVAYIEFLGKECIKQHFIKADFIKDVLLRESVSSTAFTDCLAVPHAINQYASHSFICVLHNDMPIPWGRQQVNFVLLIGVAQQDMKYFKDAFNIIIELYSDLDKTVELLHTKNFDAFRQVFTSYKVN